MSSSVGQPSIRRLRREVIPNCFAGFTHRSRPELDQDGDRELVAQAAVTVREARDDASP